MGKRDFDFEGLAQALLSQCESLLVSWFPSGKIRGHEFVVGDLAGNPGESLSINIRTGKWADFSSGDKGGDLVSLYAAIHSLSQGNAAKRLSEQIGFTLSSERATTRPTTPAVSLRLGVPPEGTAPPAMISPLHGEPSASWCYRNAAGEVLFYVARYNTPDGKKELRPYSFDLESNKWVAKSLPAPRPLYGLELLAQRPEAPVLIVEGEKAADAARVIAGRVYVVITWPNGGKSVKNADWSPLYGRKKILIWPDNDDAGREAAALVASLLVMQCAEVKIIDFDPTSCRVGWDAADALESRHDWNWFVAWAKPCAKLVQRPVVQPEVLPPPAPPDPVNDESERVSESRMMLYERLGVACSENGNPICNVDNTLRVLEGWEAFKDLVWFDEFHCKYLTRWRSEKVREWNDTDDLELLVWLQREIGLRRISDSMVNQAVRVFANRHPRNEPRDWMESLKWDGEKRIDNAFVKFFGTKDSAYSRAASKNFWISLAARIFRPGCKADHMVILEGGQGKFKSTALAVIGGKWYSESHEQVTSKDFFASLQGSLIVEISELDAFSKAEVNTIKKTITCQVDRFRPPYGRSTQDFPRQSIFVGSTNDENYLQDHTGGRRFWPIRIGEIDVAGLTANREQLFAEAVHRFKAGESWHEMPKGETEFEQEERRSSDIWESIIDEFLFGRSQVTIEDIATAQSGLNIEKGRLSRQDQKRIVNVLRVLGFERGRFYQGPKQVKGWVRRDVGPDK